MIDYVALAAPALTPPLTANFSRKELKRGVIGVSMPAVEA